MQLRAFTVLALTVASIASCERTHPNYCPTATHHNCLELDADVSCRGDEACSGATPVCDVDGSHVCVQCTTSKPAACMGTTPVCSADNACHGCSAHAQCESAVCLPDGSCASDASVAYVAGDGADGACSKSAPCKTLDAALKQGRAYVKIAAGLVKDMKATMIDGQTVAILADTGAQLDRDGDGPILVVASAGTAVQIYDLEITGASGLSGADGIQLNANGGEPKLDLTRVNVHGNQGNGITATGGAFTLSQSSIASNQASGITSSGGTVTVSRSSISSNQAAGITSTGGTLTVSESTVDSNQASGATISGGTLSISRSVVAANQGGGVVMTGLGTLFTIRNNFIYRNGNNSTASVGGLSLVPTGSSSLEFNTIVDNQAKASGLNTAGGVLCDESTFAAAHNLIFRNTGGMTGNVQTTGACTYGDSFNMPGASIVDNTPGFAHPNALPFDYHLTAASPSSIVDAAGACTGVDFDGDTRPIGTACDLGADERRP